MLTDASFSKCTDVLATWWLHMFDVTAEADANVVIAVANWEALSPLLLTAGLCVSAGRVITAVKWT